MLSSSRLCSGLGLEFVVWLVSDYSYVFKLLSVVSLFRIKGSVMALKLADISPLLTTVVIGTFLSHYCLFIF